MHGARWAEVEGDRWEQQKVVEEYGSVRALAVGRSGKLRSWWGEQQNARADSSAESQYAVGAM